ncbi:MAG: aconitase family protein, partial [Nitrososphaerota archaeon]
MGSRSEIREAIRKISTPLGDAYYYSLTALEEIGLARNLDSMPLSLKILLENVARSAGAGIASIEDVKAVGEGRVGSDSEIPFMPSRVLLQDFTGVPLIVDLAAMREVVHCLGGDPSLVNPTIPSHLVVDHSIQVDHFGVKYSYWKNLAREF